MQHSDINHCTAEKHPREKKGKILFNQQQADQLKMQTRKPMTEIIILAKV